MEANVETGKLRKRRISIIILSVGTLLLMGLLFVQGALDTLPIVTPNTPGETLVLYALSTLNFIAFFVFLLMLGRNLLKLRRERRQQKLGSKFESRMVTFAIAISLLPVAGLFFFSYALINRSVEKWFTLPTNKILEDVHRIREQYQSKELNELNYVAQSLADEIELSNPANIARYSGERSLFEKEMRRHRLLFLEILSPAGDSLVRLDADGISRLLTADAKGGAPGEEAVGRIISGPDDNTRFLMARKRAQGGTLVIVRQLSQDLTEQFKNIAGSEQYLKALSTQQKNLKKTLQVTLGLITIILLFAATWLALYVARGISTPVRALAQATDEVARGNLDYRVDCIAEDELAVLVKSFNQMAEQLSENRQRLEQSAEALKQSNMALDERRRYIEAVLQSLSTGVISLDSEGRLTTINEAAMRIFELEGPLGHGSRLLDIIDRRSWLELTRLIRRARRSGTLTREIELQRRDGSILSASVTVTALKDDQGAYQGTVITIEDLTELIKAQRAAAWSEVARRMAHEIKNPLTPIQLSAERIAKNVHRHADDPAINRFESLVDECTSTIKREVMTLQRMVDEFSRFARLPEAQPQMVSVNEIVANTVRLYDDRLDQIELVADLAPDLPRVSLDVDQFKQTLVNLVDNAIEAIQTDSKSGRITVTTRYQRQRERVQVVVSDTGHGIAPADRDKLFLPYFSTRKQGTGLGLAIVHRIVTDHGGRVYIEENLPRGTRMVIELPIAFDVPRSA